MQKHDSNQASRDGSYVYPCGTWVTGDGRALCDRHETQAQADYPQGWRYYPGDVCEHGVYVGGSGIDRMCGACESG